MLEYEKVAKMFERFMNKDVLQGVLDSKVDILQFNKVAGEKVGQVAFARVLNSVKLLDRKLTQLSLM
jgi:hypothetical protein